MSEAAERSENIPAGKGKEGIPNRGNPEKSKEDFDLASIYVSDAQYNRNIYFDTSPEAVRLYLRYNHWLAKVLLYFFILVDLSLALFEEPAVLPLPIWATMLVELLCLLVFTIRLAHYAKVIPRDKFWKDPKNMCICRVGLGQSKEEKMAEEHKTMFGTKGHSHLGQSYPPGTKARASQINWLWVDAQRKCQQIVCQRLQELHTLTCRKWGPL